MLELLRIKNLAIVEELELEFAPGLNVITGETGAGKSIVLKAISLLSGSRASAEIIHSGSDRCEIEGVFQIDESLRKGIIQTIEIAQDFLESSEIIIRRVIDRKGSAKIYANGVLISLGTLQKLGSYLVEITGQHEQRSLLNVETHGDFIDNFAGLGSIVSETTLAYRNFVAANKAWEQSLKNNEVQAELMRRLRLEEEEIANVHPHEGELELLEQEEKRFSHLERLVQISNQVADCIEGEESGLLEVLNRMESLLSEAIKYDPRYAEVRDLISGANVQLGEAGFTLTKLTSALDGNPERLEFLRERISQLKSLQRKYRKDINELISYWAEIKQRLIDLDTGSNSQETLEKRRQECLSRLQSIETKLSQMRHKAAPKLAKEIESELAQLHMKQARFQVHISAGPSSLRGIDRVEFLIAPNPGAGFSSLSKTASGGELSRVLLVLKTLDQDETRSRFQIFDEVDTGVSGAVAQIVGEKLARVAARSQVLVVTHAPQVAAMASRHFSLAKDTNGKTTNVTASVLSESDRVKELARMLAGRKVTSNFEDSAKELLEHAEQFR